MILNWLSTLFWQHVDEILSLMRKRQIWYPKHYDQIDLILDLNFYNTLYDQYNNLREKSLVDGAPPMHEALTSFEMDGDILKYCKGEMPYPYGRKWNGAKRIYTVMNIKNTHFIALEFFISVFCVFVISYFNCLYNCFNRPCKCFSCSYNWFNCSYNYFSCSYNWFNCFYN